MHLAELKGTGKGMMPPTLRFITKPIPKVLKSATRLLAWRFRAKRNPLGLWQTAPVVLDVMAPHRRALSQVASTGILS